MKVKKIGVLAVAAVMLFIIYAAGGSLIYAAAALLNGTAYSPPRLR